MADSDQYVDKSEPASKSIDISAEVNDTADLSVITRSVYVGGGGNMRVIMAGDGDTERVYYNVQDGSTLPIKLKRVFSTGLTATHILGLY